MPDIQRQLLDLVSDELKLRNYSPKTIKSYQSSIRSFARHVAPRNRRELNDGEIRSYLLHLLETKNLAASSVNQVLNALRFLYVELYRRPMVLGEVPRPKKQKRLPVVLSEDEVRKLLGATLNLKHRSLLMLVYSAGLRVGEVVRLKPADIDSKRMLIHIRKAKGQKDRYVQLAGTTLDILREYWKEYRPTVWLFAGAREAGFLSERTAQEIFKQAVEKAGIKKEVSIHSLCHLAREIERD